MELFLQKLLSVLTRQTHFVVCRFWNMFNKNLTFFGEPDDDFNIAEPSCAAFVDEHTEDKLRTVADSETFLHLTNYDSTHTTPCLTDTADVFQSVFNIADNRSTMAEQSLEGHSSSFNYQLFNPQQGCGDIDALDSSLDELFQTDSLVNFNPFPPEHYGASSSSISVIVPQCSAVDNSSDISTTVRLSRGLTTSDQVPSTLSYCSGNISGICVTESHSANSPTVISDSPVGDQLLPSPRRGTIIYQQARIYLY